jgi:hypothetical protein
MKNVIIFIFLLINSVLYGQRYFDYEKFPGYSKVIILEFPENLDLKWKTVYIINEFGDIKEIRKYNRFKKNKIKSIINLFYDNARKIIKRESFYYSKYDNKKSEIEQTHFIYDSIGNLEKIKNSYNKVDSLSDYTDSRPHRIKFKSTIAPMESILKYDKKGNIIDIIERIDGGIIHYISKEKEIEIRKTHIVTKSYLYNDNNDIISLTRNDIPKVIYPNYDIDNFKNIYEIEKFRYVYNKRGFWTKKFLITNGVEKLIEKRSYK